jgi:hypothetical protein
MLRSSNLNGGIRNTVALGLCHVSQKRFRDENIIQLALRENNLPVVRILDLIELVFVLAQYLVQLRPVGRGKVNSGLDLDVGVMNVYATMAQAPCCTCT